MKRIVLPLVATVGIGFVLAFLVGSAVFPKSSYAIVPPSLAFAFLGEVICPHFYMACALFSGIRSAEAKEKKIGLLLGITMLVSFITFVVLAELLKKNA